MARVRRNSSRSRCFLIEETEDRGELRTKYTLHLNIPSVHTLYWLLASVHSNQRRGEVRFLSFLRFIIVLSFDIPPPLFLISPFRFLSIYLYILSCISHLYTPPVYSSLLPFTSLHSHTPLRSSFPYSHPLFSVLFLSKKLHV